MTETNTVARFRGAGLIEFEEPELGAVPTGEARLRVDVCALCGSDKRLLRNGSPVVPGHEIAGTVMEVGQGVDVPVGQRSIVYIPQFCGRCKNCQSGQTNRCTDLGGLIGWQRDGGFADYVDVPATSLIPVPDDIPLSVAVLGLDTVGTAAHGLRLGLRTQISAPERVLVVGCGPLGLGVLAVAQAMGLGPIDVTDPHPGRLEAAQRMGGQPAADLESHDQYDLVVEVSGARAARETAQRVIVPGAAVIALGESEEPYEMPATPRWRRTDCFTVRSFYFPMHEAEDNWSLLRDCGPKLRDELAEPMRLDQLPGAFESFVAGDLLKPYITTEEYT